MAIQAGQDYHPATDTGKIRIHPEGLTGTHGHVLDDKGAVIAPWSWPGDREVWVEVGKAKRGTITEMHFEAKPWQIIHIGG